MTRPLSKKAKRAKVVEMLDVHRGTGLAQEPLLGFVRELPGSGDIRNVAHYEQGKVEELKRLVADIWRTRAHAAEMAADNWTLEEITDAMVRAGIWPEVSK